jgi:hypothetical protein
VSFDDMTFIISSDNSFESSFDWIHCRSHDCRYNRDSAELNYQDTALFLAYAMEAHHQV